VSDPVTAARLPRRWRERAGWIAAILLAALVVCSGCVMLTAFALTARGEIDVSLLGSDWRVWQLQERGRSGIGLSQTHSFVSAVGQACRYTRAWLVSWQPKLEIESLAYEDCGASGKSGQRMPTAQRINGCTQAWVVFVARSELQMTPVPL
jgi:hypothetical protein